MTWLRSLLFNVAFFAMTIALIARGMLLPRADRDAIRGIPIAWARGTIWLLRVIVGARVEVRGERLRGSRLIAAKHQSLFDTMVFHLLADDPIYVMKRELSGIPGFGLLARRQGMIVVDREAGAAALKQLLRAAQAATAAGRQIVIFPQGTRTAPGIDAAQAPYQSGIAALYQALKLPTTPVALNTGLVWGRRSFIKRPGTIVIELLPEIPAGLPRPEFMRRLESSIEDATRRLEGGTEHER